MMGNLNNIFPGTQRWKLLLSGIFLLFCFILTPFIGSIMNSLKIPFVFVYIFVVVFTNIVPLIIIAISFRDTPPVTAISIIVLAAGVLRMTAEFITSPVPFALISTPGYLINIVLYCVLLSIIAVGISLLNTRKNTSIALLTVGFILYLLFIQKIFFTAFGLLAGN